jgi:hypothetical protein
VTCRNLFGFSRSISSVGKLVVEEIEEAKMAEIVVLRQNVRVHHSVIDEKVLVVD